MVKENIIVIYTPCPNVEVAEKIAQSCLQGGFISCSNIIESVTSLFMWEGKLEKNKEVILIMKGLEKNFNETKKIIKSLHPYECPVVLGWNVDHFPQQGQWGKDFANFFNF
jgi:periplasmic divalent cation tolerance protein